MKKTPNGLKIKFDSDKTDYVGGIYDAIDKMDKFYCSQLDHTLKTIKENPNFWQNKEKYDKEKQKSAQIVAENTSKFNKEFNDNFVDELVASFNNIGINQTLLDYRDKIAQLIECSNLVQQNSKLTIKTPLSDAFFIKLAIKYPDFILYLPIKCFSYSKCESFQFTALSAEKLDLLDKRLTEAGLFEDETFKKRLLKFFPKHIRSMNYEQALFALTLCPSCYTLLKPGDALRSSFHQNPKILISIIRSSPLVVQYLSKEEFDIIPEENISIIGGAIDKAPQVLQNLPTDFFKKHNPKYVFPSVKHKVKTKIIEYYTQQADLGKTDTSPEDIINRFPELAEYFNSPRIIANPKKSYPRKEENKQNDNVEENNLDDDWEF